MYSRNYQDHKQTIAKFNKVLVTGPHGGGNKITAHIIAKDFDMTYIRGENPWEMSGYEEEGGLMYYHRNLQSPKWSMFAPSQSGHLHRMGDYLNDTLVVFTYKPIEEIKQYAMSNPFLRNSTYSYENRVYSKIIDEDFFNEHTFGMEIEEMTYYIWENYQRNLIPNWIEIEHSSLKGHEMFLEKENRKDFQHWQTYVGQPVPPSGN